MTYELVIEEGKEKPVINFLKQLDFVSLKVVKSKAKTRSEKPANPQGDLSYFDAYPQWDLDAKELRIKSSKKRLEGWL